MELRQLEYFLEVVRSGSLSRAASVLSVAQPALSRQIRKLEDDLGVELLYRNGRGVSLTQAGEMFAASAADSLAKLQRAREEIGELSGALSGVVNLGMPPSVSEVLGARLMGRLNRECPTIQLRITDAFSGHINEWLLSGRVDIAVVHRAQHAASLSVEHLLSEDLYLFGPPGSAADARVKGSETVTLREVATHPLIAPGEHHGLRRQLDRVANDAGVKLNISAEVSSMPTIKAMARSGAGYAVLPYGVFERDVTGGEICGRRIIDPPVINTLSLAMSLHRPVTAAMREVRRAMKAELQLLIAEGRIHGSTQSP